MSAPDIDQSILENFSPLAGDARLTLLLGAGASAPSGLPNWDLFASRLAVSSGLVTDEDAARVLLSRQDQTIVLEAARTQSGERWVAHLNDALYGDLDGKIEPSPLHLAAVGHYLASPEATTLSTLNFDTLLETALIDAGEPTVTVGLGDQVDHDSPTIHHLHGVLFNGEAYTPIVGFRDYAELVADSSAWQRKFLSTALRQGPLLLAGTSYRDPDIRHWLHLILRDEKPAHPALVTIVREGLGVDRETFSKIHAALSTEWEAIGLTALRMHDLADVALVIRELQHLNRDGYQSPNERAQTVWRAHDHKFTVLQNQYSEALSTSTAQTSAALGVRASRGTLWLADGKGKLARWASEGTRYSSARFLKYVPTGHDSPWIAGEAIGTEEVKIKDSERAKGASPTWKSVLAIPVFVGDNRSPNFASAVLTFGLQQAAKTIRTNEQELANLVETLASEWGHRINNASFPTWDS